MYEEHYGLLRCPFAITPDPSCVFFTAGHREALSGLSYAVTQHKGFVVLVGEAGTGKTTLLRKLLTVLPAASVYTACILNPTVNPSEFLEMLLTDLGVEHIPDSKTGRILALHRFLLAASQENKTVILIVDEAQKLSPETLEEIRLLSNFETEREKLLQIVLAGQPELTRVLNREDLRQLKQRIALRLEIGPISPGEVPHYLKFRWKRSGAIGDLPFSDPAMDAIATWSQGIPRLINSICDSALMLAVALDQPIVEASQIMDVVRDLNLVLPASSPPGRSTSRGASIQQAATAGGLGVSNATAASAVLSPPLPRLKSLDRYMEPPHGARWSRWLGMGLRAKTNEQDI